MQQLLVSVIITTFSRPLNLLRAIESVQNQSYPYIEIIIVDDNGKGTPYQQQTQEILKRYIENNDIKYITHETNRNASTARNTGLKYSNGEFVNFLDDDDVFERDKIKIQVEDLKSRIRYDASYCNTILYGMRRTKYLRNEKEGNIGYELLTGKVEFNTSCVLFRRRALLDINGWDESFSRHQDWELMVRFFRHHLICLSGKSIFLLKKYETPNILNINPHKSVEYRRYFLKTMEDDIMKMKNPKEIFRYQIERLALVLFATGAKKEGYNQFRNIFKYGLPSLEAWGKLIYYIVRS